MQRIHMCVCVWGGVKYKQNCIQRIYISVGGWVGGGWVGVYVREFLLLTICGGQLSVSLHEMRCVSACGAVVVDMPDARMCPCARQVCASSCWRGDRWQVLVSDTS
jgi:hypothetical protein